MKNMKFALPLIIVTALLAIWLGAKSETVIVNEPAPNKITQSPQSDNQPIVVPSDITPESKFKKAMGANITKVAKAYEQVIQYPKYSTPLSTENWDLLNPLPAIENSMPIGDKGKAQVLLKMDKFVYFHDEAITGQFNLLSSSELPPLDRITASIKSGTERLHSLRLESEGESVYKQKYVINYEPSLGQQSDWPIDLQMEISLNFTDGSHTNVSSSFRYSKKNVILKGVSDSYADDVNLMIPLKIKVHEKGRYQFRANLYGKYDQPISHLVIKDNLTTSDDEIVLKAHASLLRESQDAGPYMLKEFNITKVPAKPGDKTEYGYSEKESYSVKGQSLDLYSDEPYEDEANQQRLEFLKKLGG